MKLIHFQEEQDQQWKYYDLSQDPHEMRDLVKTKKHRFDSSHVQGLRKLLEDHRNQAEGVHTKHRAPVLDEEMNDMLKSLGYVQGNKH
jgi:hypothetical protein